MLNCSGSASSKHIAAVGAVDFHQAIVPLVQFKQAPLGGGAIQVGHALADEREAPLRDKHLQALDHELACGGMAARFGQRIPKVSAASMDA